MKLYLTLSRHGEQVDLGIEHGSGATVVDLLAALKDDDDATSGDYLVVPPRGVTAAPNERLADSDLLHGDVAEVRSGVARPTTEAQGFLEIISGESAGTTHLLRNTESTVGRGDAADIKIVSAATEGGGLVGREHLRVSLGDVVTITDLDSKGHTRINGEVIAAQFPTIVGPDDAITVADVVSLRVIRRTLRRGTQPYVLEFNRPPRSEGIYKGCDSSIPAPPDSANLADRTLLPAGLLGALAVGATALASGRAGWVALLFLLPFAYQLGFRLYRRRIAKKDSPKAAHKKWRKAVRQTIEGFERELDRERTTRFREAPNVALLSEKARAALPPVWERDKGHPHFLQVKLGSAEQQPMSQLVAPERIPDDAADVATEIEKVRARRIKAPIVSSLLDLGALGIAEFPRPGEVLATPSAVTRALAASVVCQVAALHAPTEVAVLGLFSEDAAPKWDWLKWLPHTRSIDRGFKRGQIAVGTEASAVLLKELARELDARINPSQAHAGLPSLVIVADTDMVVDALSKCGRATRSAAIVVRASDADLPHWCVSRAGPASNNATHPQQPTGRYVLELESGDMVVVDFEMDVTSPQEAELLARRLAPLIDMERAQGKAVGLPAEVYLSDLLDDPTVLRSPERVAETWMQSTDPEAAIGLSADGPVSTNLRTTPHGLLVGATGSGKSALLNTILAALALQISPDQLNLLLIDFKAGSSFPVSRDFPHTVGMVTDLHGNLILRVLDSLTAELRYRKRLFDQFGAVDLDEMRSIAPDASPPRLLVVIDEFKDFVDGIRGREESLDEIVRQGRSYGMHLLMAGQKLTGVVSGQIKANTSLRLALQSLEEESLEIVGTRDASNLEKGQAIISVPGGKHLFRFAFHESRDERGEASSRIDIDDFALNAEWAQKDERAPQSQLQALDRTREVMRAAVQCTNVRPLRRPWLQQLPDIVELESETAGLESSVGRIPIGRLDQPLEQLQDVAEINLVSWGNLLVCGSSRTGKTALLETAAISAGRNPLDPTIVYGLDFAGMGLSPLAQLPHVGDVVSGDDDERCRRLFTRITREIERRSSAFTEAGSGSLTEHRQQSGSDDSWPRILLLLDGIMRFLQEYETIDAGRWLDALYGILKLGPRLGVHVLATSDRLRGLPGRLRDQIAAKIVFRLSIDEMLDVGLPRGALTTMSPPGRGFLVVDDRPTELQVAITNGYTDGLGRKSALEAVAHELESAGVVRAPAVRALPSVVSLDEITPSTEGNRIHFGLDADLQPASVDLEHQHLLVMGPPASGRTTALHTIAASIRRTRSHIELILVTPHAVAADYGSLTSVNGVEASAALLAELTGRSLSHDQRQTIVLVDDFTDALETDLDRQLGELMTQPATGIRVVVAAESARLRHAYGDTVRVLRDGGTGLLLNPDPRDGDILYAELPRRLPPQVPGRGLLVTRFGVSEVQVALPSLR